MLLHLCESRPLIVIAYYFCKSHLPYLYTQIHIYLYVHACTNSQMFFLQAYINLSIVVAGVYALVTKLLPLSIKLSFHEATELSKLDESGSGFLVTLCTAGYKNFIRITVCSDMEGDDLMVAIK